MATEPLHSDLLTLAEAAEYLRQPTANLYAWRYRREGPRSLKVGRRVLYRRADLDAYLDSCAQEPATASDSAAV